MFNSNLSERELKIKNYFLTCFWLNTLKGTVKAPSLDLLRVNILRCLKNAFFYP